MASVPTPTPLPLDAAVVGALFDLLWSAPVGLALLDTGARYVRVNATLAELNGLPPEQHTGRTPAEVLPPPLGQLALEALRGVLATGAPVRSFDQAADAPGAPVGVRHRRASYFPVRADGRVVGVAVLVVETTAQRRAEQAAEASRSQLEGVVEALTSGFAVLDAAWRFTHVNSAAARALGRARLELLGRGLWEVAPELAAAQGPWWRELHRALAERVPVRFEDFSQRLGRWLEVRASPVPGGLAVVLLDVHERKDAEAALQRQEARFRSLVAATSQAVWTADAQGRAHPEQDSWDRLAGYGPGNPRPEPWLEAVHPEDRLRVRHTWADALATGEPFSMEYRLRRGDRSFMDALARVTPVREPDGRVREWVGTLTDVTAQRAAVRRTAHLHTLTARLSQAVSPVEVARAAVEEVVAASGASHAAVYAVEDPRPGEAEPHLQVLHQVGAPPEEVGRSLRVPVSLPSLAPEVLRSRRPLFAATYAQLLEHFPRAVHFPYLGRLGSFAALPLLVRQRAVGVLLLGLAQPHALRPEDRAFLTACAQATAVGLERAQLFEAEARARREAELRARRAHFLADATRELAGSLDLDATLSTLVRLAVPAMADHCALDLVEADGTLRRVDFASADAGLGAALELLRRTTPHMEGDGAFARVLREGRAVLGPALGEEDLRALARSPEHLAALRQLQVRSRIHAPLLARGRTLGIVTLISRDADSYTQEDVALADEVGRVAALALDNARLFRDAQEAVRARDDFLAVASHELKTPLTGLRLQLQLVTDTLQRTVADAVRQRAEARAHAAHRQAARLGALVDRLLDVSRLVTGRLKLEPEPADLAQVVRGVAERMEGELAEAGSALTVEAAAPVPGAWDVLRVEQVVTNLLSNAGRYGRGRPVRVAVAQEGAWARVVVEDAGVGIPAADLARVFGKFERAVGVRHQGGMGLGLYVARELVEAMGGRIEVDSRPDEGSRFTVHLPV